MKRIPIVLAAVLCAFATACARADVGGEVGNNRIAPTDPAAFGSLPYATETVGGAAVRVYRDLAYGTRGDAEGEGAEYAAHAWGYHNHRSGTYFDVYAADAFLSSAAARANAASPFEKMRL